MQKTKNKATEKKYSNEIYHIKLGFVNAYLVKTNKDFILIDTGLASQYELLKKQLISYGCTPGKLKLIILTHADMDHIGNCDKLWEEYSTKEHKVKIAIHKAEYDMLKSGVMPKRTVKGAAKIIFFIFMAIRKLSKNKFGTPKLIHADILLEDGQNLKKYGFDANVVHVPGHTKGSIAIITKNSDIFSGDTIVNNRKPQFAYIIENQNDLSESINKLKKENIKRIFPGHGKPFLINEFDDFKI